MRLLEVPMESETLLRNNIGVFSEFWSEIPVLSEEEVKLAHLITQKKLTTQISVAGNDITVTCSRLPPVEFTAAEVAEIWFGNFVCELFLSARTLHNLVQSSGIDLEDLPENGDLKGMIFEQCVESYLDPLKDVFESDALVLGYETDIEPSWTDPFFITFALGEEHKIGLALETTSLCAVKLLEKYFVDKREANSLVKFPVTIQLNSAAINCDLQHLRSLQSGGGILLPKGWTPFSACSLVANRQFSAPVEFDNSSEWQISGDWTSLKQTSNKKVDERFMKLPTDALEIDVAIELARAKVNVQELSELENGSVLPFDTSPDDDVFLVSDGLRIAKGKLVRINDRFGVQVLEKYV